MPTGGIRRMATKRTKRVAAAVVKRTRPTKSVCASCGDTFRRFSFRVLSSKRKEPWCSDCIEQWRAAFHAALVGLTSHGGGARPVDIADSAAAVADAAVTAWLVNVRPIRGRRTNADD